MYLLLEKLNRYLDNYTNPDHTLIVAVSGGLDSMVLLDALVQSKREIIVSHINYHLRGEESNLDESLIRRYCGANNIRIEVIDANIESKGKSIQAEAREIRYEFFERMRRTYCAQFILTAHHQGDKIETAIFNLLRGTGIKGLSPFNTSNQSIILRPLIDVDRIQISQYADINCIPFRLDQSNRSNTYSRNKLRNSIIPKFTQVFPNYEQRLGTSIKRLSTQSTLLNSLIESTMRDAISLKEKYLEIHLEKLDHIESIELLLKEYLRSLDFNEEQSSRALMLSPNHSSKKVISSLYTLYITKSIWYLVENSRNQEKLTCSFDNSKELLDYHFDQLEVSISSYSLELLNEVIQKGGIHIDLDKINWPLQFRSKADGDTMHPYSLKGKVKKLKKIYSELQIPIFQREYVPVISDSIHIIAIYPFTIDYNCRITEKTKQVLTIKEL